MKRPTSVTVIAIINIVLAVLGFCGIVGAIVMRLKLLPMEMVNDPTLQMTEQVMADNPGYQLFTDALTVLGSLMTILLLVAAIGLFTLKNWARWATIGYGIYAIVVGVIATAMNYLMVMQPMMAEMDEKVRVGMMIGQVIGFALLGLFFIYYMVMIFLLTREKVVTAFTSTVDQYLLDDPEFD